MTSNPKPGIEGRVVVVTGARPSSGWATAKAT
jgi:NAD(P)-dependent dehydrogenase (short-subunit alcohol dehydrogenase family)